MVSKNFSLQECDAASLHATSFQTLKYGDDIFLRNNATNHHIPEDRKLPIHSHRLCFWFASLFSKMPPFDFSGQKGLTRSRFKEEYWHN
jgi:hypothetical protein